MSEHTGQNMPGPPPPPAPPPPTVALVRDITVFYTALSFSDCWKGKDIPCRKVARTSNVNNHFFSHVVLMFLLFLVITYYNR